MSDRMPLRLACTLLAVLLSASCADVGDDELPPVAVSAQPGSEPCRPAPDQLAFAVTYGLKPAGKLRRPFAERAEGRIYIAADILEPNGTVRSEGAVWVAKDGQGTGLAALTDNARSGSSFPDARSAFSASPTDAEAVRAQQCVKTG